MPELAPMPDSQKFPGGGVGVPEVVGLDASQIANPTAAILANVMCTYQLNVPPYTRYQSTGTALQSLVSGGGNAPIAAKSSTTLIGDSRFAYGMATQAAGTSGTYSNGPVSWLNDFLRANGGTGFDILQNRAVGGKTLAQIISEQLPSALTDTTECLMVMGGINSMTTTGETIASMVSLMKTLLDQASVAKKIVVVFSISPIGPTNGSSSSKQRCSEFPLVNNAWRKLCSTYTNVLFVDTWTRMTDPTSSIYEPVPTMFQSDDLHQSSIGARMEGLSALDDILSRINLTRYKTQGANLLPGWTGTAGTRQGAANSIGVIAGSGNPPAGWDVSRISGGSSATNVTITTLGPDHIRLTVTANTASATVIQLSLTSAQQTALLALLNNGDTIQGAFGFQCTLNQQLSGIYGALLLDANTWYWMGASPNETTIQYPQINHSGYRSSEPYTIGSAPASCDFRMFIAVGGVVSTDTTTVDIWLPTLNKLT